MSVDLIDRPGRIRPGEELDIERLGAWLGSVLPELVGASSRIGALGHHATGRAIAELRFHPGLA
jgi:hypothetical protein